MITDYRINEGLKARYYDQHYWSDKTLNDYWNDRVAATPDAEYVVDDEGVRLTYREVDDKASRLAAWLIDQGMQNGDILTYQMPTWSEYTYIYVAALKVGAVMHPVPRNFNADDLEYIMNLVETEYFICPTFNHKTDYEDLINSVKDKVPTLKTIAVVDKKTPSHTEYPTLNEIFEQYEPCTKAPESKADDIACILSTSGTTGRPKAVLFTHNNIQFMERVYTEGVHRTKDDVMIMQSPLNHATGFFHGLISNMLMGARVVLQDEYKVARGVELMQREGVTWSHGATPFVFDLLNYLEANNEEVPTLEIFISGGAPVPPAMVAQCAEHGFMLCESYGSTESCPHVYVPVEKAAEWNGAWSGIACDGIEVRVVDPDTFEEVPYGEQGLELSRGPNVFVGYLKNEESYNRSVDADGWFNSGDLCFMDEEGRIRINGRMKEIIIRGGENISANEVDNDLTGCPGIGDHATIGMPDDRLGERICTFCVLDGDERPTLAEVQKYLGEKGVPKRLWPERIEWIDEIPHTLTGKVQRFKLLNELKERMAAEA